MKLITFEESYLFLQPKTIEKFCSADMFSDDFELSMPSEDGRDRQKWA